MPSLINILGEAETFQRFARTESFYLRVSFAVFLGKLAPSVSGKPDLFSALVLDF
jgi:hypothetical protein